MSKDNSQETTTTQHFWGKSMHSLPHAFNNYIALIPYKSAKQLLMLQVKLTDIYENRTNSMSQKVHFKIEKEYRSNVEKGFRISRS